VLKEIDAEDPDLLESTGFSEDELQELLSGAESDVGAAGGSEHGGSQDASGGGSGAVNRMSIQITDVHPDDVADLIDQITDILDGTDYIAEAV